MAPEKLLDPPITPLPACMNPNAWSPNSSENARYGKPGNADSYYPPLDLEMNGCTNRNVQDHVVRNRKVSDYVVNVLSSIGYPLKNLARDFELDFDRDAKVRVDRHNYGHAALTEDGKVIVINGHALIGSGCFTADVVKNGLYFKSHIFDPTFSSLYTFVNKYIDQYYNVKGQEIGAAPKIPFRSQSEQTKRANPFQSGDTAVGLRRSGVVKFEKVVLNLLDAPEKKHTSEKEVKTIKAEILDVLKDIASDDVLERFSA